MGGPVWLFFDSGARHPHENMAIDEALLGLERGHAVVFRLYDWEPPGLSLGYFQRYAVSPAQQAEAFGAVVTRRTTGGGAILHKGEITFSIAGDAGTVPFDSSIEESYRAIHAAIAAGLKRLGVGAELRARSAAEPADVRAVEGRCFYRITSYDLVSGGRKLVGSAQRRTNGRVLHHGSLPFEPNEMTPQAASLRGLAGPGATRAAAAAALKAGFEEGFGVRFAPWRPSGDLLGRAERIRREKYAAAAWLMRR